MIALQDRTTVAISGNDATHFLHNLITTNVETLSESEARPGALLTPQGKVLFDFLVSHINDGYRLDVRRNAADDFIKRLTLYKLRANVTIAQEDQMVVGCSWVTESGGSGIDSTHCVQDMRFAETRMMRHYHNAGAPDEKSVDISAYEEQRVKNGVMEYGVDYGSGDVFAHDVSLDQNYGIDFRKGCYVGQEVVSRMHHRNTARRRIVIVSGDNLQSGATLIAGNKPTGTLATVSGSHALAIVRLDRVAAAQRDGHDVSVDDQPVSVHLPTQVGYSWPDMGDGDNA